jgi:hypothetical protein
MSMNEGLDSPATLRSPEEARKLIEVLNELIKNWPRDAVTL